MLQISIVKRRVLNVLFLSFLFSFFPPMLKGQDVLDVSSVRHRKLNVDKGASEDVITLKEAFVEVVDKEAFIRNDSLYVSFQLFLEGSVVKRGESLSIIPEFQRGNDAYELPAILINGKKRTPYYEREKTLATPETYWKYKPYATLLAKKHEVEQVDYNYSLPLPASKENGKLVLKYMKQDCCNLELEKTDSLEVADKGYTRDCKGVQLLAVGYSEYKSPDNDIQEFTPVKHPEYEDKVTYIKPRTEEEKIRRDTIKIHINYPVDKAKVLSHFADNLSELNRIDSLFRYFYKNEGYTLLTGQIAGYASPEATYQHNLKLSKRRAEGFYDYFLKEYGALILPALEVKGFGEDWAGLEKAVEQTNMRYKYSVLRIINDYGIFQGREKKLMDLAAGIPYRYMLQTLFPPLRRIELSLAYRVRPFSADEAQEVWEKRPKDLSQRELYEIAEKTNEKKPLEVAANYFPDDVIANINASSVALINGELNKAYEYLQKVWTEPKAFNNIGVYYMLNKDYQQARVFFEKALPIDKVKAQANLNILNEIEQ